jgi:dTDP-4-dehydrorhamnose 3,5-epimerase
MIINTTLQNVLRIERLKYDDNRGYVMEIANIEELNTFLLESKYEFAPFSIKQLTHSNSKTNVMRGIHAEPIDKLVTVVTGLAYCVIVDLRTDQNNKKLETFGKYEGFWLGDKKTPDGTDAFQGSLFIPRGFGNSVCVVEGPVEYVYAVSDIYENIKAEDKVAINLFDKSLNIKWPVDFENAIISDRDAKNTLTINDLYEQ